MVELHSNVCINLNSMLHIYSTRNVFENRFNVKFACVIKIYNHNGKYSVSRTLGPSAPDQGPI